MCSVEIIAHQQLNYRKYVLTNDVAIRPLADQLAKLPFVSAARVTGKGQLSIEVYTTDSWKRVGFALRAALAELSGSVPQFTGDYYSLGLR